MERTVTGSSPHILLTGATGQVGGSVLADLLAEGVDVTCLGRASGGRSAEERIRETLKTVGGPAEASFRVVTGDLVAERMGLDADTWADVAQRADRIIHCAARVEFEEKPNNEPFRTNVGGVEAMLELAHAAGGVPFTHVSTAYVCGERPGLVPEAVTDTPPTFRNPYEASKWNAEQRVWAAHRAGLPVAIARPSIIVGSAQDGRAVHFQGFYLVCRAVSWLCQMTHHDRAGSDALILDELDLPGDLDGHINLVPADYVGAAVARIGLLDDALGGIYHLTHPTPPTLDELVSSLATFYRLSLPKVDARRGRPLPGIQARRPSQGVLRRRHMRRVTEGFWRLSSAVRPYFAAYPQFDVSQAQTLLRPLGITPAAVDNDLLDRVLEYAEQVEFGRRR